MIKTIIKYDFYLAKWFASSSERIVPGASFLFLNQISFMAMTIYCIVIALLPFKIKTEVVVVGVMSLIGVIMYGFKNTTEKFILNQEYNKQLKALDNKQDYKRRMIGLLFFIAPIIMGFASAILLLGDYSNR